MLKITRNKEVWDDFVEFLEKKLKNEYHHLARHAETRDVFKAQGRVEIIQELLRLRSE